jgi:epoxyqueuosine reductase
VTKEEFRQTAAQSGFALCRFAAAGPAPHAEALARWLDDEYHGEMGWMKRTQPERSDPALLLPGVRTVIVLAVNYFHPDPPPADPPAAHGRIARYARSEDYHEVIGPRLATLCDLLAARGGTQRHFVDGGPVLERDWADACGVSWHGKSTMAIHPELGTWFFLAAILTTLDFEPDPPIADRCGRCTRCIDACPTQAITGPYRLDARRCISYLTIELPGSIPEELRPLIGNRVYGCDDCQLACPWNKFARAATLPDFDVRHGLDRATLVELFAWTEADFDQRHAGSAIRRTGYPRWLRNIAVGLGNARSSPEVIAALQARADHPDPVVREHVAWALARHAVR